MVSLLPPNEDWTFVATDGDKIGNSRLVGWRLYCGEVPDHQTWAFVGLCPLRNGVPHRASCVMFWNLDRSGRWSWELSLDRLTFMYPFKVFTDLNYGNFDSTVQPIRSLILYLFLKNEYATHVFADNFDIARKNLSLALRKISAAYHGKGIDQIPTLHPPGEAFDSIGPHTMSRTSIRTFDDDSEDISLDNGDETIKVEPRAKDLIAGLKPADEHASDRTKLLHIRGIRQLLARESEKGREKERQQQALISATDRNMREEMNGLLAKFSKEELVDLLSGE
ncbi:hypothetical protein NX059_000868 [Plenodomus lindquistii]|nr:hypothetical protein NX059_000868 [Plenodomus lindquistii]